MDLRKIKDPVDYSADYQLLKKFFLFYLEDGCYKYLEKINALKGSKNYSFCLDLKDLLLFDDSGLFSRFSSNCFSYLSLCYDIIDEIAYENIDDYFLIDDVYLQHRLSKYKERFANRNTLFKTLAKLIRFYTIRVFYHRALPHGVVPLRAINSAKIGHFVSIRAIVTKVSEIRPSMSIASYICENCGAETFQEIKNDTFDLLEECASEKCKIRKVKGTLYLVNRGSKFTKSQVVHIQELTNDIPLGSIPRMIRVEFGSLEEIRPGDFVVVNGVYLPRPYTGFRRIKCGLINDSFVYGLSVNRLSKVEAGEPGGLKKSFSLDTLVSSFAPEIFGMKDLKKILLLLLVRSPTIENGLTKIRGNLNVLLIGDPGIAKSQLLKTVVKLSKRGIYTTGRGSTNVGLTASVTRDVNKSDYYLEAGALVLADKGICCIDELDKMNEDDRVAIHEAMEQQTISIAKAGINTTLNARCSILAAMNKTIKLPVSLTSRFDIICNLKDDRDLNNDLSLASFVTALHMDTEHCDSRANYDELSAFIEEAKAVDSRFTEESRERVVSHYLRAREAKGCTPRFLLSLMRLTLAHARVSLRHTVSDEDINEAIRLIDLFAPEAKRPRKTNVKHTLYNEILALLRTRAEVPVQDLYQRINYSKKEIEEVITEFTESGIWEIEKGNLKLIE